MSADKFYGDADMLVLATDHNVKATGFVRHGLGWLDNPPDLNPITNLWGYCHKEDKKQHN